MLGVFLLWSRFASVNFAIIQVVHIFSVLYVKQILLKRVTPNFLSHIVGTLWYLCVKSTIVSSQ